MRAILLGLLLLIPSAVVAQGYEDPWSALAAIDMAEAAEPYATGEVAGVGQWLSLLADEAAALVEYESTIFGDGPQSFWDAMLEFWIDHGDAQALVDNADLKIRTGDAHLLFAYVLFSRGEYDSAESEATNAILAYWLGESIAISANLPAGWAQTHLAEATAALDFD